ncbi:MAG: alpha/beta hydrolase [Rhizobiaceae bacterium]|nr:alpha/beta hydrolase [Rhizobiaceae bacterium]
MTILDTRRLEDFDAAYSNGGAVEGSQAFPERWTERAEAFRETIMADGRGSLDQPYGEAERQVYDLFLPVHPPKGLVVFIHGGYWMRLSKSFFSHLAQGPLGRGYAVAMPSYTLAPEARIEEIVKEIGIFLDCVAEKVDGPITIAGHSAGGHLAARIASSTAPISDAVRERVEAYLSISGVHDLRPLLRTDMNATLHLDEDEARTESPALLEPANETPVTLVVGADELPEFLRQTALLASAWYGMGIPIATSEVRGRHHYDVLDALVDPKSEMTAVLTPGYDEGD